MDKQYWAKGTGFGTGSTTSSYNMHAARAKHQMEEKYVSICFSILTEFLSLKDTHSDEKGSQTRIREEGGGGPEMAEESAEGEGVFKEEANEAEEFCGVEVIEMLCKSCLLPALASYLLNDSGTVLQFRYQFFSTTHHSHFIYRAALYNYIYKIIADHFISHS